MERAELTRLIAGTLGPDRCVRAGDNLFLVDPTWGAAEKAAAQQLFSPAPSELGWLMIPSGGTSGNLKFARHDEQTIAAAVAGFCAHFSIEQISSIGVLPLHHVSGFMAWMRTVLTGGHYLPWDWKKLEAGERPLRPASTPFWTISLVPTQLQRLIASAESAAWLSQFDAIFIGGAPSWPALLAAAAAADLPLSLGYGMTETAAMAAGLLPGEFRAGERSSGLSLPHLKMDLTPDGVVRITGESVYRGYFPQWEDSRTFLTEDLANFDFTGRIRLLGRRDAVIITGGKKVDPAEVEAVLRAAGLFADVAVLGVPDAEWGQRVTAFFPATQAAPEPFALERALSDLAGFKRPRRYVAVQEWPRNAQGKVNRKRLLELEQGWSGLPCYEASGGQAGK
jgi:O-succinylbenzoic acid--CoA ligase